MVCIDVAIDATSSFAKARTLEQRALILASSPSPEQIRAWHRLATGIPRTSEKALPVDRNGRGLPSPHPFSVYALRDTGRRSPGGRLLGSQASNYTVRLSCL